MNTYRVKVSQAGGEYFGYVNIKCNTLEIIDSSSIKINGAEIIFECECIENIEVISID